KKLTVKLARRLSPGFFSGKISFGIIDKNLIMFKQLMSILKLWSARFKIKLATFITNLGQ
ncbi:MAG: hypothetical protein ABF480_11270, partial [Lacticaseibacillus paracasei]